MLSVGDPAPLLASLDHAVRRALLEARGSYLCPRPVTRRCLATTPSVLTGKGDAPEKKRSGLFLSTSLPQNEGWTIQHSRRQQPGVPCAVNGASKAAVVPARPAAGGLAVSESPFVAPVVYNDSGFSDEMLGRLSTQPFSPEVVAILHAPLAWDEVSSRPVGGGPPVPYLPEIKYRRILNKAFGPGAWALLPVGPLLKEEENVVSRDYQLFVFGRLVSEARGKQDINPKKSIATAMEGVKSNALMRCCKDLGIASELWDPQWVRKWQLRNVSGSAPRW